MKNILEPKPTHLKPFGSSQLDTLCTHSSWTDHRRVEFLGSVVIVVLLTGPVAQVGEVVALEEGEWPPSMRGSVRPEGGGVVDHNEGMSDHDEGCPTTMRGAVAHFERNWGAHAEHWGR